MLVTWDEAADFTADDPVLRRGEIGIETDTNKLKIGDGATAWTSLPYVVTGNDSPTFNTLTIYQAAANAELILSQAGTVDADWFLRNNEDTGNFAITDDATGTRTPFKFGPNAAHNLVRVGVASSTTFAVAGKVVSSHATEGMGYSTGAGGTVTQLTSKGTAITINKMCGQFTTHNAALGPGAVVSFVINNSTIAATDTVIPNLIGGHATNGTYRYWIDRTVAGATVFSIENRSAGSLSEALVFNFFVFKVVTS